MTIEHAIPKIEWAIELYYNSVRQEVRSWRSYELEARCGRESYHPAEGALGPLIEFGGQTRWWQDVVEKASTQQKAEPPGLRLIIRRTRKTQRWWPKEWGSIYGSSVRSPTPSHTQTFQIKWEVYFLKKSSLVFIHCVNMYSACICVYMHIYSRWWLYNIYIIKWFQLLLPNTNNSIQYQSFSCTQWSGYKYCCLTLTIRFKIRLHL